MTAEQSFLIECPACGIGNLLAGAAPEGPAVCSQCRETLLRPGLAGSHKGHACDNCGMAFILKNETEFTSGESECRCGGSGFSALAIEPFVAGLKTAEASGSDEGGGEDEGFDWCRPGPDASLEGDYNNIFDDDPGLGR